MSVDAIIKTFVRSGEPRGVKPMNSGRINTTYRVDFENESYTLQKINKFVFTRPDKVMYNILAVTEHIRNKIIINGGDPERDCLRVIKTEDGLPYYLDEQGEYWRVYKYIDNASTYDITDDPIKLFNAGFGFGTFQKMMSDFDASSLFETIADFHNTKKRMEVFKNTIEEDKYGRVNTAKKEMEFLLSREDEFTSLTQMQEDGVLPTRVTHNDTKVNNILIDNASKKALCVIDLDTVMPGLSVFDFGDAARFISNPAGEEETDMSKVGIDLRRYESFADGFLTAAGTYITKIEKEYMSLGAKIIAMELGMRFLGDYLNGDVYFKTERDGQNLDRAKCQLTLAESMEKNFDSMINIINKY